MNNKTRIQNEKDIVKQFMSIAKKVRRYQQHIFFNSKMDEPAKSMRERVLSILNLKEELPLTRMGSHIINKSGDIIWKIIN